MKDTLSASTRATRAIVVTLYVLAQLQTERGVEVLNTPRALLLAAHQVAQEHIHKLQ